MDGHTEKVGAVDTVDVFDVFDVLYTVHVNIGIT